MSIVRRCLLGLLVVAVAAPASAEQAEINVAQQFGVAFLPLMLMERDKLVEKHAKAEGLSEVKVGWIKVAGPSVMNDGVISGALQFISVGAPSLATLWDKTRDNVQIKGMSALTTYPLYLNVRNPSVKSIRDFSDKDKIAVPSVKISTQAIMLQMAAAKEYGEQSRRFQTIARESGARADAQHLRHGSLARRCLPFQSPGKLCTSGKKRCFHDAGLVLIEPILYMNSAVFPTFCGTSVYA